MNLGDAIGNLVRMDKKKEYTIDDIRIISQSINYIYNHTEITKEHVQKISEALGVEMIHITETNN